ncbi:MAG TPA: hypothetical protein VG963_00710, partial [Polyangiaceae bacterium]|nr:hypothetical protein [Polyangiaceae bacterium]
DYEQHLLEPMYRDLAPLDPEGILRHEWANARGCIARFERMAIEIRLLDLQECPAMDLAIAALVVGAVKELVAEGPSSYAEQKTFSERELEPILRATIADADEALVEHPRLLRALGHAGPAPARAKDVWRSISRRIAARDASFAEWQPSLDVIYEQGCLARRISTAVGQSPGHERLVSVYRQLAGCLDRGEPFRAT